MEPLPRSIITAAQLKNQREQSNTEDALYSLMGTVPDKVLHSLAPFQREAVQFIIKNNGRALVADEMGLGRLLCVGFSMVYHPPLQVKREPLLQLPQPIATTGRC